MQTEHGAAQEPATAPQEVAFVQDGVDLTLRVFPDPSGLRGQVFFGEEKLAGVQIFHRTEVDVLLRQARGNRAVLRAVERLKASASS